ncbi:Tyrosine-protein kinase SYK [Oopsacas minuta]|uniref:Tyrosine-protein kinase SYK n=1 Tax=Oopsacas minuta TaxID=111878 RepID=A0AAV7K9D7_9METZ|nr:Tyrosine-protein kinase SYK [Oopsacas minuta]
MKWYAPECIYYKTFTSKGDVWSFGVAAWEILSYGEKPFKNMSGPDILRLLDNGGRLSCPKSCPYELHSLLMLCWQYEPKDRPTFEEVYLKLNELIPDLSNYITAYQREPPPCFDEPKQPSQIDTSQPGIYYEEKEM